MNLKRKTFFAITVKLLFSVTALHAQAIHDSAKQGISYFLPTYNKVVILKQQSTFHNYFQGNFYVKQLPFFCTKELQVQKAVGFPVKFRLSTVEYCDKMEGKSR